MSALGRQLECSQFTTQGDRLWTAISRHKTSRIPSSIRPAKKELSITIYLLSGVKLTGRIRSFDKYSVVLEANGQEQLIFKHAISTVVMGRVASTHVAMRRIRRRRPAGRGPAATAATASGTEG